MSPFTKITDWPKRDWDDWESMAPNERERRRKLRTEAERRTKHDLQKEVQHLLQDVHEVLMHPWPYRTAEEAEKAADGVNGPYPEMTWTESRLLTELGRVCGAQKSTAALLAVSAYEAAVTSFWLKALTWVLAFLTIALVILTFMLWRVASHTDAQVEQIREYAEQQRHHTEKKNASARQIDGIIK